jgi:2-desacetyl-2-hydroxyethyl bacteriochlorophyllide A dehydrogenase
MNQQRVEQRVEQGIVWTPGAGVSLVERELRSPGEGELLVTVEASGLCGTDLHIAAGEYPFATGNVVLGHEYAGLVADVGPGVSQWAVGDRVVIDPNIPCRQCRACHRGETHLCANPACLGVTRDGGLASSSIVPATQAYRIPDGLSTLAASLTEPLACALHAVDRAELRPGDTAAVIGAGPIGLLCTSLLRAAGATRVLVSEPRDARRAAITTFGGEPVLPGDLPEGEADVVLECVGLPVTLAAAVPAARTGGTIVWVGVAAPDATVAVTPYDIFRRELTIRGTYTNPFTMDRSLALLASGAIPWEALITHRLPLDRFDEAWTAHRTGASLKVTILPNGNHPQ